MFQFQTSSIDSVRVLRNAIAANQSGLSGTYGKRFLKAFVLGFGLLAVSTVTASAQTNGHSCTIEKVSDGNIQPNIANNELTSKSFGGFGGQLKVTATRGRYRLVVDDPLGFSQSPPNGGDAMTMETSFLGNGATNFAERPGNARIRIRRGVTFIETHFVAKKLNQKTFPAGNYQATLTLRCE